MCFFCKTVFARFFVEMLVSLRRGAISKRKQSKTLSESCVFEKEKMRKKVDRGRDRGAKNRNMSHLGVL